MIDLSWVTHFSKENRYTYHVRGENPQILIFGESEHFNQGFIEQQEVAIRHLTPQYVLDEKLGAFSYDPRKRELGFTEGSLIGEEDVRELDSVLCDQEIRYMFELADRYKVYLIGCDLSGKEDVIAIQEINELNKHKKGFELARAHSSIYPYCELKMGRTISRYVKKSSLPLVAIVGRYHIRKKSKIHEVLEKDNLSYITIKQGALFRVKLVNR